MDDDIPEKVPTWCLEYDVHCVSGSARLSPHCGRNPSKESVNYVLEIQTNENTASIWENNGSFCCPSTKGIL